MKVNTCFKQSLTHPLLSKRIQMANVSIKKTHDWELLMKHLYHNILEVPETIRLISSCFSIDTVYHPWNSEGKPVDLYDLYHLAKSNCFHVEVFLTSHNQAYFKKSKKATVGTRVSGWVNLAHYDSLCGLQEDRYCQKTVAPNHICEEE